MPSHRLNRHRAAALALVATTALTAAACNPIFGTESGPVRHATLTSPSGGTYAYQGDTDVVTATVDPTSTDGNIREAFWRTTDSFYPDQQACTTWETTGASAFFDQPGGNLMQPGLAMRIAQTTSGLGIRAITVTENVWYAAPWVFNVHVWDSTSTQAFTQIGSFDLRGIVGFAYGQPDGTLASTIVSPPWYVCARTKGSQFSFKVWTHGNPEPAWTDPTHVFTVTLPDGWDYAGYSGDYIGHLHAGQWATFSNFSSGPLCLAPDMIDTAYCEAKRSGTSTSIQPPPTAAGPEQEATGA